MGVTSTRERSGSAVLKTMPRAVAKKRAVPWQLVTADAIVRLTLKSRGVTRRNISIAFHVRNALQLGLAPELALALLPVNPRGVPLPSGVMFPAKGAGRHGIADDTVHAMAAAFEQPRQPDAFAIHVHVNHDGDFIVGDTAVSPDTFATDHLPSARQLGNRTLILVSDHGDRAAQALARATGRPVLATPDQVRVTPDGAVLAVRSLSDPADDPPPRCARPSGESGGATAQPVLSAGRCPSRWPRRGRRTRSAAW